MGKRRWLRMWILPVLSLLLLALPSLVPAQEKSVAWFSTGPLTGPGSAAVLPVVEGMSDYVKELNDRGGVDGVKIKFIAVDDRYDAARGISAYQRYRKEPKLALVHVYQTAATKGIQPMLERDKNALITPGGGSFQAKIGRVFLATVPYQDAFGAALDWMVADWKKKGQSSPPVVGYMGWDNPAGKETLDGAKEYAEKLGVKFLPPEFYPPGSLKHDTWLTRLAEQGANYVYIQGVDPAHTNIIRDAHALGLTDKIQFVCDVWGPLSTVGLRLYPKELEGVVLCASYLHGDERLKHRLAHLWTKYQKKPIEDMPDFYMMGLSQGMIFEAALKIALKDAGYDKIDGDAMYNALQKLTDQDISEGIIGKIDYSPTSRRGTRQVKFYRLTGGKHVPISDWLTCPDTIALHKW